MNDFLIHGIIPVSVYSNVITFRDTNESFKGDGDLLKTMRKFKFNIGYSSLQD